MKRSQWTLPVGHRANRIAHLWVFPLFFWARGRIDILNDPMLDPLFKVLSFPKPDLPDYTASEDKRLEQSLTYSGYASVEGLISIHIVQQFRRLNAGYYAPLAAFLHAHPLSMPETIEDARALCRKVYDIEGPWRAYLSDVLTVGCHCSGLSSEMNHWSALLRDNGVKWLREVLDENERSTGRFTECVRVITR